MSGMELLFINTLKAFMPKEAAEKIAGMIADGTFDRIGSLPSDILEIKSRLEQCEKRFDRLELGLAKIYAAICQPVPSPTPILQIGNGDRVSSDAGSVGPIDAPLAEHGTDGRPSGSGDASSDADDGHVSQQSIA